MCLNTRTLVVLLVVLATAGCGGTGRFVQRQPGEWTVFRAPARNAPAGATASGQCKADDTKRTMRAATPRFLRCYELALSGTPSLHGGLTVEWLIDSEGKVTKARITDNTLGDAGVEQCVVDVIGGLEFPALGAPGFCVVKYPFFFSPRA